MKKHMILLVLMFVTTVGFIFSQENNMSNDEYVPKNTFTIDMVLTGATLASLTTTGIPFLGTAVQYERQLLDKLSIAGRLEYKGIGMGEFFSFFSLDDIITMMQSFSAEGHLRYYPTGNTFFFDGMLGYAFFNYSSDPIDTMSHYFKFGGKMGLMIDFGKPGGFVLEPSVGYYGAIGDDNPITVEEVDDLTSFFNGILNLLFGSLIKGFFVGGPQLSLGIGYRF
jgi:hypothetical protein